VSNDLRATDHFILILALVIGILTLGVDLPSDMLAAAADLPDDLCRRSVI
jgi:hypothetical protein